MTNLEYDIQFLPGVGPKRAELLKTELNIHTIDDLLNFLPFRYIDRSKFYTVRELEPAMTSVQLKGYITGMTTEGEGHKKRLKAQFSDGTGSVTLVWFSNVQWVVNSLKPGVEYVVFGRITEFKAQYSISHPEIEEFAKFSEKNNGFVGVYPSTEKIKNAGISGKVFRTMVESAFKKLNTEKILETLPAYVLEEFALLNLHETLTTLHMPNDLSKISRAQFRIKFEELFWVQLAFAFRRKEHKAFAHGFVFHRANDKLLKQFYKQHLPFSLTGAQVRVMGEIRADVESGKHMNRLIQGDVGSGKTLIAVLAMLMAVDNGHQACLMAPTEILAQQHFQSLTTLLADLPIRIELLTGSTKKKQRTAIHEGLQNGAIHILVGTHALLEDVVQFRNLGLCVIDEQHRFGVAQRARLWKKNSNAPHILVMTATPIPRTLAMTLYGDLDVSVIDELPPGRKPIKTVLARDSQRLRVFGLMREQIALGRQVYVVYPLIKESERLDYKDLEDGYASITRAFPFPNYATTVVHGQMKAADKEFSMNEFVQGRAHIMVATTVIEVGVNVPNATVMIIESAERFGLSQLHQLRGRVGRGGELSYCVLMASNKLSNDAQTRLETMVQSNDGFEIAEVDMKLRGPGDIEGTQQSGLPVNFKLANLAKDGQIVQLARNVAFRIIEQDPNLEHTENAILAKGLKQRQAAHISWRNIS
ncbi:MAG: ATP-dependent DNA helicase RecG [Bacteroidales bacterium]|jgi:ATP-dependent DNA helicase RecG|nr:ATP-dependent DNA helicase RecG [Bacteroidales bacterium]